MSKTYRCRPKGSKLHRNPNTRSGFMACYTAIQQLREEGYEIPNRLEKMGNPNGNLNPLKYSSPSCAALKELPKLNLDGEPIY